MAMKYNNKQDRDVGALWERHFCAMVAQYGYSVIPHQIGREGAAMCWGFSADGWQATILPDVSIIDHPMRHYEIKHKAPTAIGWNGLSCRTFGLEEYRFRDLLWFAVRTQQDVMYMIHNHELGGGKWATENYLDHWVTADIKSLADARHYRFYGPSYFGGELKTVSIFYWPIDLFLPAESHFRGAK